MMGIREFSSHIKYESTVTVCFWKVCAVVAHSESVVLYVAYASPPSGSIITLLELDIF